MELTTTPSCSDLHSSSLKIIVAHADRERLRENIPLPQLKSQFKIYQFDRQQQLVPLETNPDLVNATVPLELAPNFCLSLVAFSTQGKKDLTVLSSWWSDKGHPQSQPAFIELDAKLNPIELQAKFWQQMSALMAGQNRAIAQRIVALQRQYLGLRTLHENMHNASATVEKYLSQAKLPPLQLAWSTSLDGRLEPSTIGKNDFLMLQQLLPISSGGLAAIELHIAKRSNTATGALKISLRPSENDAAIASWQIDYSLMAPGWLCLDLPSIDIARPRDLMLVVEWHTVSGSAPALSLTKLQSIPEARLSCPETTLAKSLAFKLWRGLPGTRTTSSDLISAPSETESSSLGYLGEGAISRVKNVTPQQETDKFDHVRVFQRSKIQTHPRNDGTPTIALLPYCFPPTANSVRATIATEHEAAGIIEYAMAIIDPNREPADCLNREGAIAFADWLAVPPQTPTQIILELTPAVTESYHILIAAKLPPRSHADFGWAHWLDFYLDWYDLDSSHKTSPTPHLIPPDSLRNASLPLPEVTFNRVQLIESGQKLQVHPTIHGDTVAVVARAISPGTRKVIATVCTENESAGVIEYAIAIVATDEDIVARKKVASVDSENCSGWQQIPPNTIVNLELAIAPTDEYRHLVLATRIPPGGLQDNAWARWLKFEYQ